MSKSDSSTPLHGIKETPLDARKMIMELDYNDPLALVERVYLIWWKWADFHLYVVSPDFEIIHPPRIIQPALIADTDEYEFVYPIHDFGHRLSTSKAQDMYSAGLSMCKLYLTIEKMIAILVDRLKLGGVSQETEVQVAFGGHELAQRKAFESIINLSYNVFVSNFDPGVWGERYLQNIKVISEKGYGYPPATPRDTYKKSYTQQAAGMKK